MLANKIPNFDSVRRLLAVHPLSDVLENFRYGLDTEIGCNQRIFQLIEKIGINLFLPGDDIFNAVDQPTARFLDAGFEPVEQIGFSRNGAKECLNCHESSAGEEVP